MPTSYMQTMVQAYRPDLWDVADSIGQTADNYVQEIARNIRAAAAPSISQFDYFNRMANEAQRIADSYQRVNSTFVPSNPIESNMVRVGESIRQAATDSAARYRTLAGEAATRFVDAADMAGAARQFAKAFGAAAGLAEMAVAAGGGDLNELGRVSSGVLLGAIFVALAPAGLSLVALIGLGYLFSKLGEQAWDYVLSPSTGLLFTDSQRWTPPRRDPLVLDLDGDGIETVGANSNNPILFDNDADGIKTGTGWVKADDGFLVLDRNLNGTIDNGRELFGDATQLPNGSLASDGFAALTAEDTNNDGVVNHSDARWSNLKVWRDLNQDGVSQSGELFAMSSLGIASISTAASVVNQDLGGGNILHLRGSFSRSNGSTGTTGTLQEVSNINLAEDTFNRRFTDFVQIRSEIRSLPDLRGSGLTRDLREAASLGTAASNGLREQLALVSAGNRTNQIAQVQTLIERWAATAAVPTMSGRLTTMSTSSSTYELSWNRIGGVTAPASPRPPLDNSPANVAAWQTWDTLVARTSKLIHTLESFNGRHYFDFEGSVSTTDNGARGLLRNTPSAGRVTFSISLEQGQLDLLDQAYAQLQRSVYGSIAQQTRLAGYLGSIDIQLSDTTVSWNTSSLQSQIELLRAVDPKAALFDVLDLALFGGAAFTTTDWNPWAQFASMYSNYESDSSVRQGMAAFMELVGAGTYVRGAASDWINASENDDSLYLGAGDNVAFAGGGNDLVYAASGADRLFGGAGNDTIAAGAGNDTVTGGSGNDTISDESGNDTYLFAKGWGADVLTEGGTGSGDLADVVQFTDVASTEVSFERRGNDLLLKRGTTGDQLTVTNFYNYNYYYAVYVPPQIEQFRFTDVTLDVNSVMSRATTYGTAAADVLSAYYTPTGQRMYLGDGNDSIQGSQFADTINLEAGDDYVQGYGGNDTIDGGLGNDSLSGNDGNDQLLGGAGNDTIAAGAGNDTVTGGSGNDTISDESGNDTYLFAKGWGADVLTEGGTGSGDLADVVQFTDVASTEVSFERRGNDLLLKRGTTGDQLTVTNFYNYNYYYAVYVPPQIEQFRFTDVTLDVNSVMSRATTYGTAAADVLSAYYTPTGQRMYLGDGNDSIQGSQFADTINLEAGDDYVQGYGGNDTIDGGLGNDSLSGNDGNDQLLGGAGNDTIAAGAGNDTVTGGSGNDTISDESGNDTYLFAKGWGADVLTEGGTGSGDLADVVQFTDVASTEVSFERRGNDLLLKRGTTGDQLTVTNFYNYNYYYAVYVPPQIEQFRFTDVTLDVNSVMSRATTYGTAAADVLSAYYTPTGQRMYLGDGNDSIQGSQFADTINLEAGDDYVQGYGGNDTIDGGLGNDSLSGNDGNDQLLGGAGNDTIAAGAGNDTVTGGSGNDTISDESGNDTYLFAKGWGADVLTEGGTGSGDLADVVQFTDVASTEVSFERRGNDLLLKRGTTGDQLTVTNFYNYNYYYAVYVPPQIEQFRFTDVTLDVNSVMSRATTYGTAAADVLSAYYTPTGQRMYLGDGNDSIQGSQFADTINLEAGDDYVQGYGGNDTIDGGLGNDSLSGNDGNDQLLGGAGNDTIAAGAGNDTVTGGSGNDTISDESGNDTYLFAKGWGADVLTEGGTGSGDLADVVQFTDVASTEVSFERRGNDLLLKRGTTGDQLTVTNFYNYNYYYAVYVPPQIEQFRFTDVTLDVNSVMSRATTYGTAAADVLSAYYTPTGQRMYLGDGNDSIQGSQFADTINLEAGDDYVQGYGGNDTIDGGLGNDSLSGNDGNDQLLGGAGNDTIAAGAGNDTVTGGSGNDTISDESGNDTYLFAKGWGADVLTEGGTGSGDLADVVQFTDVASTEVSFERRGNDLLLKRGTTGDQLTVTNFYNYNYYYAVYVPPQIEQFRFTDVTLDVNSVMSRATTYGTAAADVLSAYYTPTGQRMYLGDGNDSIQGSQFADTINLEAGDDYVQGYGGNDTIDGGLGNDSLSGNDGNDTLIGGTGSDALHGDAGFDLISYIGSTAAVTVNLALGTASGGTAQGDTFSGIEGVVGSSFADSLIGDANDNRIDGGAGADSMAGGGGNDTYVVDGTTDVVTEAASAGTDTVESSITYTLSANVENLTLTGTAAINATGNTLNNALTGNAGANRLDGGAGSDTMAGGAGNDVYVVNSTTDVVIEGASAGTDHVESSVTYTLGANLENLVLTGTTAINGTGNTLVNALTGNAAANVLNGGAGADTMSGGLGDDIYVVDNAADVVTEAASAGTDRIDASITTTLGANVENLTLTGTSAINGTGNTANNIITGNSAANVLNGGAGNDTLNGAAGIDTLIGGIGDDIYVVDVVGDIVTELAAEGTDTIQSAITWTLGTNVENLTLTGTSAINGTGNTLNNVLTGNAAANTLSGDVGNDTLNGGAGIDTLIGGTGNDIFVVDNAGDVVTELVSEGTDIVQASITWTLGANLENLTLTGTSALNGTGNTLNNVLTGNSAANVLTGGSGNDTLSGGAGADTLIGGLGNDTYVVDAAGDVITEVAGEGTDSVQSSITFVLAATLENLTLTGTAAINGTGNTANNIIAGNSAANVLNGGAGNDTLTDSGGANVFIGGAGNDTLNVTSTGIDRIAMARGHGVDTLIGTGTAANDVLEVSNGIAKSAMALMKTGNDLIVDLGAGETLTLRNWYAGVRNVGTLKIIGDAGWVPGQTGTPTLVETLTMASLAAAFDAARLADPLLTRWPLDSFGGASFAAVSETRIGVSHEDMINPIGHAGTVAASKLALLAREPARAGRTSAVDDSISPPITLSAPYSPNVSVLETVMQPNLKSFMKFWNPEAPVDLPSADWFALPLESSAESMSISANANQTPGDMVFGAPRAISLAGPSLASFSDPAEGWARTLPAARMSPPTDMFSSQEMAQIQPVARTAPWWEGAETVTEVSSKLSGEVARRPEVTMPFRWEFVHTELMHQLTSASESAIGEHVPQDMWAITSSPSALSEGPELQHAAIVEGAQRVAGRLGQRLR